ncbi:MAG: hypothetical protein AAGE52_14320 [Myxococcota bacterium]
MSWRTKKKVSYFKEMLLHKYNINSGLGSLAAGVVLSIPFGGVGFLPVIAYGAGVAIASLFVPGSATFRANVDRRKMVEQREAARQHLIDEIEKRVGKDHAYWQVYGRMLERRDSLRKVAEQQETAVTQEDIDRLDDATVDYLGLWLARIAIHERSASFDERTLARRIADIDTQLETVGASSDKRRLLKAKKELENLIRRREEMKTREASMEATMLSMSDTFDEVFQRVMANPTSREEVAAELKVAVERMNAEEELDYILEDEIDGLLET